MAKIGSLLQLLRVQACMIAAIAAAVLLGAGEPAQAGSPPGTNAASSPDLAQGPVPAMPGLERYVHPATPAQSALGTVAGTVPNLSNGSRAVSPAPNAMSRPAVSEVTLTFTFVAGFFEEGTPPAAFGDGYWQGVFGTLTGQQPASPQVTAMYAFAVLGTTNVGYRFAISGLSSNPGPGALVSLDGPQGSPTGYQYDSSTGTAQWSFPPPPLGETFGFSSGTTYTLTAILDL